MKVVRIRLFGLLMLGAVNVLAQSAPALISYQGRLADSNGLPLATADYALEVRIYSNQTGGSAVWGPQLFDGVVTNLPGHGAKVPVVQGYFNVILGPNDTNGVSILDAFSGPDRYVGIRTNGGGDMRRQQILSVPYAVQAEHAGSRVVGTNVSSGGVALSGSSAVFSTNSIGFVPVGNLSVGLRTTGRPVMVSLVGGAGGDSYVGVGALPNQSNGDAHAWFRLMRDGDEVAVFRLIAADIPNVNTLAGVPPGVISFLDVTCVSGPHRYLLEVRTEQSGQWVNVNACRLMAVEL